MKIYWSGAASISKVEGISLEDAQKIWDKARYDARNLKTALAGLPIIIVFSLLSHSISFLNLSDPGMTIALQIVVLIIALVIVTQMNFMVANYKVNQYFDPDKKARF